MDAPISVAVVDDFPVITHGVARMLADDPRFIVIELAAGARPQQRIDVALHDCFATLDQTDQLPRLLADANIAKVLLFTWAVEIDALRRVLRQGADGYLSKSLDAASLAEALVRAHAGDVVIEPGLDQLAIIVRDWPGRVDGLSARESEIVTMITQGLSNDQIAHASYLSINSVKSSIRSAYRKMGVESRSQAVLWGAQYGLLPRSSEPRLGSMHDRDSR